jgi:adenosylmethionine-8-amino-7-oxononanoate aminotransferase
MTSAFVFPRHCHQDLPTVAAGDGVWLIDSQGKRYLDACGGAAVSCLGHSPTPVLNAVKEQLNKIAFAHSSFFTSEPAEALAEKLISLAPTGIDRVYFVSGGSEAVESAIKLTRQYFLEADEPKRQHFIARKQSYHGNTLGALSAGGNQWRRAPFSSLLSPVMHHIEPCHYWRFANADESEYDYGQRVAQTLEDKILLLGAKNVAAFIAEPVVGATMGAVPAVKGYFKRIRQICDHYGVLLILDEVMCGTGRTGRFFACEHDQVNPDIICVAKGLGAGIQPIGAMLCSNKIYNTIAANSGFFQHGHTYIGHATACAAGLAVLQEIEQKSLLHNVNSMGDLLKNKLQTHFSGHKNVGNIRGRGLFIGLELVNNNPDKAPLDPTLQTAAKIKKAAMQAGLMCYPMSGSIDGKFGEHILLAPPYIINRADVLEIVKRLDLAMTNVPHLNS